MLKSDSEEGLRLLELAVSKIEALGLWLCPLPPSVVLIGGIASIRLKQAEFCCTCSPPQPAQAREYLVKAAAKCEQAKRMNDHTHYAMYSYLFPCRGWFNNAGSELHGLIKMIDASLGGEDALTHRMTCYQQATTHYEEALRISIHDRDYAKLDRIVTNLCATLDISLAEHYASRRATRGTTCFSPHWPPIGPLRYRRDHFVKDNKVSIDTIASTCESAVQMIPQDAEIWRVDAKGRSVPTFDGYNKLDLDVHRINLHSSLGCIFYMLGDSCDSSEAVREQKQEYFKRARINVELATLGVELATSGVSSLSDAPDQDSFGNADNKARLERSKVRLAVLKASRTSRVIQAPQVAL
jgi:hypothetical protein